MNPIRVIAFNTFREIIRNEVLYAVFAFAFLLIGVSALFGSVTIGDRVAVIKDFGLFALTVANAIIVSLAGVTLLERELKRKTIYNLLSKPVRRYQFVLGKYFGLVLVGGVMLSLMSILFVGFTSLFEGRVDLLLFQGVFFIFLELLLLSATALFFSSLVVTTVLAGLFTFSTFLAGHSYAALDYFLRDDAEASPLRKLIQALQIILPDLNLLNVANEVSRGVPIPLSYVVSTSLYAICFAAGLLTVATLIFQRRDFQ